MKTMERIQPSQTELDLILKTCTVSRETLERFSVLVGCVYEWQRKTNLVSPGTLDMIWTRHIIDSLQCVAICPDARRWVDLGSGGGFPGLVVAAVLAEQEGAVVQLVESNLKKAAFLRQTSRKMGVDVIVHAERVESVTEQLKEVDVITARAFAPLYRLLEYAAPLISAGSTGLFHKGRGYESELKECVGLWEFDLVNHPSVVSDDSTLLEISNLRCMSK